MPDSHVAVVIEDDPDISELTALVLAQSGFTVVRAPDGPTGIAAVREHDPVLTTLDVQMPGMNGFEVAASLRGFSRTYLIMITARTEEADVVRGFEAGADDYLTKPFRPRELRARADAMLRRGRTPELRATTAPVTPLDAAGSAPEPVPPRAVSWVAAVAHEMRRTPTGSSVSPSLVDRVQGAGGRRSAPSHAAAGDGRGRVRFADLELDPVTGRAVLDGRGIELDREEVDLLTALMATGRRVRSKADLALALRGEPVVTSYFVNEADKSIVDAHITGLRRKLGDDADRPRFIEDVRGVGYRMAG